MKQVLKIFLSMLLIMMLAVGCTKTPTIPDGHVDPNDLDASIGAPQVVQIGVPPTADSIPIYLAEENGYFKARGIDVEVHTFPYTATNKDPFKLSDDNAAIMSLMGYVDYKTDGLAATIVTMTDGIFPLVYKENLVEGEPVRMALVEKGISNYLADYYLADKNIEKVFISDEVLAIQMLETGEVDAAFLPEPLATIALIKGLKKDLSFTETMVIPNAVLFEEGLENEEEVRAKFIAAYNQAAYEINQSPEIGKAILVKKLDLNPDLAVNINLPTYHEARTPSETFVLEIASWLTTIEEQVTMTQVR